MKKDAIDNKIIEMIKKDENISNPEISRILGIPEKEVATAPPGEKLAVAVLGFQ